MSPTISSSPRGSEGFAPSLGFKATDPLTIPYSVGGVFDFTYEGPDVYLDPANSNALKKYLYVFIEAPIPVGLCLTAEAQFSSIAGLFTLGTAQDLISRWDH